MGVRTVSTLKGTVHLQIFCGVRSEIESKKVLTDDLGFHFLELTKLKDCANIDGELSEWLNFFRHGHEEYYMVSGAYQAVVDANSWFENFKANDYMSSKAFQRAKHLRDEEAIRKAGWEDGREEGLIAGREEGKTEGKREDARKMLDFNMDIATISAVTGLSAADISALKC